MTTALTGIKPTGTVHVGNYLGMYRPALALAERFDARYFIADYHALTTVRDPDELRRLTIEVAAGWLALGLDADRHVFYRQSDLPEVFELAWILGCSTAKGLLNRAHAYKDAADDNVAAGRPPDDGINAGLYNYPVLMAADILLFDTDVVPVGGDQRQHLEITRDIAGAFNAVFGEVLKLPDAHIEKEVEVVPGLDGRKMSKSYDNVIPIFAAPEELRKLVMRVVTDSRPPDEPKDPETNNIFNLYRHVAPGDDVARMRQGLAQGGLGYGEAKQMLFEALDATFAKARRRYEELMTDVAGLEEVLADGARRARALAQPVLQRVRDAIGAGPRLA